MIFLSFQTGLSFVRVAVVCAILERISGFDPSSGTTDPRYLKLLTVPSFSPLTFMSVLMPSVLLVISLVFSALLSMPYAAEVVSNHSTSLASTCSSPASPSMSSAKCKLVIVLPPMLTVPLCSSSPSVMILSKKMLKRDGESKQPCLTLTVVPNQSPMLPLR
ncbi:hypothetical protein EB796_000860 [Bugula neritina]|uniref:Uncharacterized protein n=1 Tax=Bugula neritina TaxID=10212 RepID=A0A7J7KRQ8_BUGNE|nr:hypothetical protein EB796_000860 [Bugula neritina]